MLESIWIRMSNCDRCTSRIQMRLYARWICVFGMCNQMLQFETVHQRSMQQRRVLCDGRWRLQWIRYSGHKMQQAKRIKISDKYKSMLFCGKLVYSIKWFDWLQDKSDSNSWQEAVDSCQKWNRSTRIVAIHSAIENEFVKCMVLKFYSLYLIKLIM